MNTTAKKAQQVINQAMWGIQSIRTESKDKESSQETVILDDVMAAMGRSIVKVGLLARISDAVEDVTDAVASRDAWTGPTDHTLQYLVHEAMDSLEEARAAMHDFEDS